MGTSRTSKLIKWSAGVLSALLFTGGFTPTVASAAISSTVSAAKYEVGFEWGVPVTLHTATANQLHFNSTFDSDDYSANVGKTLSFTNPITVSSPLTSADFVSRASFRFFTSGSWIPASEVLVQPEGGTDSGVPTSVVVPAGTVAMNVILYTDYNRPATGGHAAPQAPITVNYSVKLDGALQNIALITDRSNAPQTGLWRVAEIYKLTVDEITGQYDTTNVGDSEADIMTCVDNSGAVNVDNLTARLISNGGDANTAVNYTVPFYWGVPVTNGSGTWGSSLSKASDAQMYSLSQIVVMSHLLEQQGSAPSLPRGLRGPFEIEVLNGNGQDVTIPCAGVAPTSAPTWSSTYGGYRIDQPTDLISSYDTWAVQIYLASAPTVPLYTSDFTDSPASYQWPLISFTSTALPHGVPLVAKYLRKTMTIMYDRLNKFDFISSPGPVSAEFTIPLNGVGLPNTMSNGTGPGQANLKTPVGSEYDFSDAYREYSYPRMFSDGSDGFLRLATYPESANNLKLFHLGKNGLDPNFAGTSTKSVTLTYPRVPEYPSVAWYGARDKWVVAANINANSDSDTSWDHANYNFVVNTGSIGSGTVVTSTISGANMNSFCATNYPGSKYFQGDTMNPLPSPTAKPIAYLGCSIYDSGAGRTTSKFFIVQINTGANASLTKLYQVTKGNDEVGAITGWGNGGDVSNAQTYTAFPFASAASDTAVAFLAVSGYNDQNTWKLIPSAINLVRIKMDGTVTETANPFGKAPGDYDAANNYLSDLLPSLPGLSVGSSIHSLDKEKHYVATTGAFDAGTPYTLNSNSAFSSPWAMTSWSLSSLVGGATTANLYRMQFNNNNGQRSQVMAPVSLDLNTNIATTGEVVEFSLSDGSDGFFAMTFDEQGALNVFTQTDSGKYGWVKWNPMVAGWTSGGTNGGGGGNGGGGSNSLGTVTKVSTKYVLAGLGGSLTLTGTGLNLATTVTIGGVSAPVTKKTATSLTVTLPKNLSSGAQPVVINFASGDPITGQSLTYIAGKIPQAQVIAPPISLPANNTPWTGTGVPLVIPASTDVGLGVVVSVAPAATCAMVSGIPTIVGAGTCTLTVTQAGDLGTKKVTQTTKIVIAKGALETDVDDPFTITDNPADTGSIAGQANDRQLSPSSNFSGATRTYSSSNTDICTVDEAGLVSGVSAGTCVITVVSSGGNNWATDTRTVSVTVAPSSNNSIPDVLPELTDGAAAARNIPSASSVFVPTNDSSLLVKWDKAKGLLSLQSKGIYTGYILAETTFTTANSTTYTCTNVFGTTKAMPGKTATQKKAAFKGKVFSAATAACKDSSGLSVPANLATDFLKIKKTTKAKGNATTIGTKTYESVAQTQLKGFTGTVTIKVTRYRAWPTTMKNQTGAGKRIPTTVRITAITLQ